MDPGKAIRQLGGKRALLEKVARVFLDTAPALLKDILVAFDQGDARKMEAAAHSIQGAASNLCAEPVRGLALRLEKMGRDGGLDEAGPIVSELEAQMERLRASVQAVEETEE